MARKAVKDTELRAPHRGLVSQRLVQPGERVAVDGRMLEIVDLSRIELEAAVAPEDVVALRVGQAATLQVDGLPTPARARGAHQPQCTQTGTRAVMTYLAWNRPPPAPAPGPVRARHHRDAAQAGAGGAAVGAAQRPGAPYVLVADGKVVQRSVVNRQPRATDFGRAAKAAVEILKACPTARGAARHVGALQGTALTLQPLPAAAAWRSPAP
jgi:membrane fusion protein (multidrug efflux system)